MKEKPSNPPYLPSEELIEAHKQRLKKKHIREKRKSNSKSVKDYYRDVTKVPRDTSCVIGTHFQ